MRDRERERRRRRWKYRKEEEEERRKKRLGNVRRESRETCGILALKFKALGSYNIS
jgi:hypothetical protein